MGPRKREKDSHQDTGAAGGETVGDYLGIDEEKGTLNPVYLNAE
jgi:hypothetical protein